MLRAVVIVTLLALTTARPGADTLTTVDGKTHEGRIELLENNELRIVAESGESLTVALAETRSARRSGAPEQPGAGDAAHGRWMVPATGILTSNGSFLVRPFASIDEKRVRFEPESEALVLTASNTAAIFFHPLSPRLAEFLGFERVGVLMRNGDFMEGQFVACGKEKVTIQSVLFGRRTFSIAKEAAAVFLRAPVPGGTAWSIEVGDGSRLQVREVRTERGGLVLNGSPFQNFRIPVDQLVEIRRGQAEPILAGFEVRWKALAESGKVAGAGAHLNDGNLEKLLLELAIVQEDKARRTAQMEKARVDWQRRMKEWNLAKQKASRAKSDVSRTRSQAKSKDKAYATLLRSMAQAERDVEAKRKQVEVVKVALRKEREILSRIAKADRSRKNAESKVKNAERGVQNAERIEKQSRANHKRFLDRMASTRKASREAVELARRAEEQEIEMRRESEEARQRSEVARQAHNKQQVALREVIAEQARLEALVAARRKVLDAANRAP